MNIDYIVTYVNGEDEQWRKLYEEQSILHGRKISTNSVRYRDFGTLKYLFRGIAENMPWIRNLYLIVQSESQIPDWVNRDTVHVVFHDQIIDYRNLPTYNSNVIELYMHRIPGLSEYFLYGNDDMFTLNPTTPEDWFDGNGNPKIKIKTWPFAMRHKMYRHMLKATENLCCDMCGKKHVENKVIHADHNINPMRKSIWEQAWQMNEKRLFESCSTFREAKNITQELSNFYSYLSGKYTLHNRNNKYIEFRRSFDEIHKMITRSDYHCICINDSGCEDFKKAKTILLKSFNQKYQNPSKYEINV